MSKHEEQWQNAPADVLINAYARISSFTITEQTAIVKAMENRGFFSSDRQVVDVKESEALSFEERWGKKTEANLIESYRQLEQYDINSREAICAEIKKRGLEAKAANKGYRVYTVDLKGIGEIPFGSILKFVWKWAWACIIVSIPLAILFLILFSILTAIGVSFL